MIREVKNGFYVTAMLGRGADPVTGEYSRGANGLWIENGELAYPVQEVTVAGNLLQMLQDMDAHRQRSPVPRLGGSADASASSSSRSRATDPEQPWRAWSSYCPRALLPLTP